MESYVDCLLVENRRETREERKEEKERRGEKTETWRQQRGVKKCESNE